MNGILIIDKPRGWTSHDVVARVRRVLKVKKAGHGGTLDPLATGVLPVYLNEGTKLVPFNLEDSKHYLATMRLGQETDTFDAEGKIIAEKEGVFCTREEIEEALGKFRGIIRQTPPLFSALKQGGLPLYKRVRRGEKPVLSPRETTIHALVLKDVALPFLTLEVTCSRGTYIRSLCADIGRALGWGAHLVGLRRYRSGKFTLAQALSMDEFIKLAEQDKIKERIIPLQDGVEAAKQIVVETRVAEIIRQGRSLSRDDLPPASRDFLKPGQRISLLQYPDRLLAIAEILGEEGITDEKNVPILRLLRVFNC